MRICGKYGGQAPTVNKMGCRCNYCIMNPSMLNGCPTLNNLAIPFPILGMLDSRYEFIQYLKYILNQIRRRLPMSHKRTLGLYWLNLIHRIDEKTGCSDSEAS